MVIKLSTEHMVEVGLPQLCLVNDITRRLNGEAVGNPVRQPLGKFRLQLGEVPGRGHGHDHFSAPCSQLAQLAEVLTPELFTGNVAETAIPGGSDSILLTTTCLPGQATHHLRVLTFISVDEDDRDRNTGFPFGYATRDVTSAIIWLPFIGPSGLKPYLEHKASFDFIKPADETS